MTDEHLTGAELVTVGHRVGGLVIHFPAVICTSSPNTVKMLTLRRRDSGASGNATGPTYRSLARH